MFESLKVGQRLRNARRIAAALPRASRIVIASAPLETAILVAATLIAGLIPVGLLALTKPTVDALIAFLGPSSSDDWQRPLILLAMVAALLLLSEIIAALSSWLRAGQVDRVSTHVRGLAQDQSSRVSMGFYEQTGFFDQLHRARNDAAERPAQIIDSLSELGRNGIALIGVLAILASQSWWLPLLLCVAMLPALCSAMIHSLRQHRLAMEMTVEERHASYFDWLLTGRGSAAEVRSYGLSAHFRSLYVKVRERIRNRKQKLLRHESVIQVVLAGVGLIAAASAVLLMLRSASEGAATFGDVALCYQGFVQGAALTRGAVSSLGSVYRSSLFLDDFFQFLELPADPLDEFAAPSGSDAQSRLQPLPEAPRIRFKDVSFAYAGSRRPALRKLNLDIEPGSLVAILGANGAGKSTLIKLLCRFYDPDVGSVLIGDEDARSIPAPVLRRSISVLFQDSLQFSGTLAENVLPLDPLNADRISHALRAANAEDLVNGLPAGLQTQLAAWFPEGTDLSGGEWQRIAMARSFAKDAPVLVLDEPTSAMDPWAEREWLTRLRENTAGRTVILITHRLTTAAAADLIHVMEAGEVVESGTHHDLRRSGGAYARLWGEGHGDARSRAAPPAGVSGT